MALLAFFVAYLLFGFVWRSLLVYRRTGASPFVLATTDDAHGYVGRAFKLVMAALGALVTAHALAPDAVNEIGGLETLRRPMLSSVGWALLVASTVWLVVAQAQMGTAWRVGIDVGTPTELVSAGLFAISRNPIFLSVRVSLLGLFFVLPHAATLAVLVAGELLIQVQVRLEEQHLRTLHGERYTTYQARVRRWL